VRLRGKFTQYHGWNGYSFGMTFGSFPLIGLIGDLVAEYELNPGKVRERLGEEFIHSIFFYFLITIMIIMIIITIMIMIIFLIDIRTKEDCL